MNETIDIVFCYRNRDLNRVKNCLDSLGSQNSTDFSVVFVDYGSDDEFAKGARQLVTAYKFCNYQYVDTSGKMWSRAEALNYGLRFSRGAYVFTADIDLVFKTTCVEKLHQMKNEASAIFFSVGYLSEKTSRNLDLRSLDAIPYSKSENFALGMVLVSKMNMESVNGYNSFYALWGLEDNDLKYRMEMAGISTSFADREVLMLHQYHPSVNRSGTLPEGWIQLMKDYHDYFKKHPHPFKGMKELILPVSRPAKEQREEKGDYEVISSRRLFARHILMSQIRTSSPGRFLKFLLKSDSGKLTNTKIYRLGQGLGRWFKSLGIDLKVESTHREQYVFAEDIKAEVFFVLKSMEAEIEDYYFTEGKGEIKLVIVKK